MCFFVFFFGQVFISFSSDRIVLVLIKMPLRRPGAFYTAVAKLPRYGAGKWVDIPNLKGGRAA
jgi:hypothetical protein